MAEQELEGMKVAILVANNFEQVEMVRTREALQAAGAQTFLIAPSQGLSIRSLEVVHAVVGEVQGMHHDKPGDRFKVDIPLEDARPEDFDALLLPGGVMNGDQLRMLDSARRFARSFDEEDKPIGVICHGSWLLVSANLVNGRTLTSWPTLQDDIRNAGGHWVNNEVVWDRNWISSRAPADLDAFNEALVEILEEWEPFSGQESECAA